MTKSWVALALAVLLGCDGGTTRAPAGRSDAGAGGSGGSGGADAGSGPGGQGPARITFTNVTPAGGLQLLWVAFNDGDGAWQTLEPVGTVYSFDVRQPRYGLAFVCEGQAPGASGEVVHATPAELPELTVDCGQRPVTVTHALTGKITGLGPDAAVHVQAGAARATYLVDQRNPPATAYASELPPGTYDLGAIATVAGRPTRALFRRDVTIAADTTADLDFAQGVALAEQPLTLMADGAAAPGLLASVRLFTGRGTFQAEDAPGSAPKSYLSFPASILRPGETQELELLSVAGQAPGFSLRGAVLGFREPQPMQVQLPPAFSSARVTVAATTPNLRPRMTFEAYPGALYYQLSVAEVTPTRVTSWLAIFSAAWLDGLTSYDFPDFNGVRGFQNSHAFQAQTPAFEYSCDAVTSTRDFARTINADPATRAGARMTYARLSNRGPIR